MSVPILSIIIVSYNTKDLTVQTIRSIFETADDLSIEVIVVDNNSSDGSVESIRSEFGKKVYVVARTDNPGFGVANNDGLKLAKGENLFLLNSDTIVQPQALQNLIDVAKNYPDFGLIATTLLYKDLSYQPQGGAIPTLLNVSAWWLWPFRGVMPGVSPYQNPYKVSGGDITERGWVGGTALLIRRKVYEQIGGFDEKIFMYAEDIEYCIRATQKGWKKGITSKASVIHIGSASGSSFGAQTGEIKGLLYLFSKYHSQAEIIVLRLVFAIGALLRFGLFGILKGSNQARGLYGAILRLAIT